MNYVIAAILLALAVILAVLFRNILWAIVRWRSERMEAEMGEDDIRIRAPNINIVFGIIFTAISVGCVSSIFTKGVTDKEEIFYTIVVTTFMLLPGLWFLMFRLNWKITVKGGQITHTSSFGRTKSYTFDYITMVERGWFNTRGGSVESIRAYHDGKKLFEVTAACSGFNLLASRLEREGVYIVGV